MAKTGYEKKDINLRTIFITIIVSVTLLLIFFVWSWNYFKTTKDKIVYENVLKPESPLLKEVRQREDQILHSYGVVDAEQGKYRIPIERAMERLLEKQSQSSEFTKVKKN